MEKRDIVKQDPVMDKIFGVATEDKKPIATSQKSSGDPVMDAIFQKKKDGGNPSSTSSEQLNTSESESTLQTPEPNPSTTKSETPVKSLTLTSDQLQSKFDEAYKPQPKAEVPKVNPTEFLIKDIAGNAPNIFSAIAKNTEQAMPFTDKMSAFDKEEISKRVRQNVFGDPSAMGDYTKQRVDKERKDIANLETAKLKYVDIDPEQGVKTITNDVEYAKKNEQIAAKQAYINQLKNSVAEVAADKVISNTDLSSFNPKTIGRKIIEIADPELNAQYKLAEKGGNLPGIRQTEMERLGLEAVKQYLRKNPDTPNAKQAQAFITDMESDFDQRNIDATAARVRTKLGKFLYNQNKSGVFGYSQETLQEAINSPAADLTPSEKKIAETVVLPTEKRIWGTDVPGSGFARSFRGAVEKSAEGTMKSIFDITGARDESQIAGEALAQQGNTRYNEIADRSWVSQRLDGIGDLTGQVAMMALTSKGMGALAPKGGLAARLLTPVGAEEGLLGKAAINLSNTVASSENVGLFINSYLNSYDNYKQQAIQLMPEEDQGKAREYYAKSMAFVEGLSEKIFADTKILKAFTKEVAPAVKDITQRFVSNEITSQVAREEMQGAIRKAAAPFVKEFGKSTVQEGIEEGIVDIADGAAQSIYGGTPFDVATTGEKAFNTFLTTAMNSPLVAGLAARGTVRQGKSQNAFMKSAITQMAANPGEYLANVDELVEQGELTDAQANEKRKLISSASNVLKELPENRIVESDTKEGESKVVPFTPAETSTFILHRLNEQILQDKIDNTTSPVIQSALKKELNRSVEIQKGIYDGSIKVNEDLQEVAADPKQAEELDIVNPEAAPVVEQVAPVEEIITPKITENETEKTDQAQGQENVLIPEAAVVDYTVGEPAAEPTDETVFTDESAINDYRVENTQTPSELAAVIVDENNPESEISKKAAEKFQQLTGEELTSEVVENAINQAFDKLPEDQKALLNENTTTTDTEVVQEQPIDTTTTESENTNVTGQVGEANTTTEPASKTIKQSGKDLADRLRKLKSKPDTANANVFGLAVGVYDGVIETIATAIENGAALADAIKTGLSSLSEEDRKNVDENAFNKHIDDFASGEKPRIKVQLGEEETKTVAAEKNTSGITHAVTEETRNDFGLGDKYEKTVKTDIELNEESDKQIKDGYDVDKLITQLEGGKVPSDVETTILKKYKAALEAQIEKNPTTENLNKLKRLIKASDAAGSEQGRALRSRQGLEIRDDSLAGYFAREFDSNNDVDLTEAQKATVLKEYNAIKEAEKAYQDKIAKLEADLKKAKAEQKVKKASPPKKQKKTHEDFVKERQDIVNDIREKLRKARGESNVTIIPYAKELIAIAPGVAKLTRSLVQEGVIKLEDVVNSLHTTLAEAIPEITTQDVLDLVAGEYNEKQVSKNEISKNLYELKAQAKLINQLADLENGEVPTSEKKQKQRSKEIEDLRKKIKDHDLTKLTAIKESTQKQIDDLEAKIKSGDFSSLPKPQQITLDKEATALRERVKQLQDEINDKRTVQELTDKLAKLQAGEEPKNDKERKVRTDEIEGLKKQIRDHDLTKLARVKSSTQKQIDDLQGRLDRGEYENIKPEPLKLDKAATDLKDKLIKLRQEREERLIKQKYANRTKTEQLKDLALEVINVPRSIMSSMDFSAPLRQGLIPTIAHPTYAAKAGAEMFKQAFSQKRFDRWFTELRESPRFKLMEQSGLYVADPHDVRLGVKEESFMNNLAEKIPVVGALVKGSERAYVSYLNKMRADLFNRMADGFENEGMTWENNEELYKGAASYINNATGRGGIGVLESAAPILNSAFFSPRLIASRLNILGLSDITTFGNGFYGKLPPKIRKQAVGDLLKFVGTGITVLSLAYAASLAQKDDDKDKISIELDPRSSDFGKIKSGNTRWDIWGGFQQYIRVIAQLLSGQTKSTTSGTIQDMGDGSPFGKTRGDVVFSFARGKLAPVPSTVVDFLKGRTVTGDKVTVMDEATSRLLPLVLQDVGQAIETNGIKSLFTIGLPSTFGVGVQDYGPRGFKNIDYKKDATYKLLYEKNVNLPEPTLQGKMTDQEFKEFVPKRDKLFKESWDEVVANGALINEEGKPTTSVDNGVLIKDVNKLSREDLTILMQSISSKATREIKKELGIDESIKERDKAEREKRNKD